MVKNGNEGLGYLVSNVSRAIRQADRAVHAARARQHSSRWRPASTAPCNQDLELRVSEDGLTTPLPFPCRQTNGDEWINVDLGVPLQIRPVEWRAWRHANSPQPHYSSIFGIDRSISRQQEQWGRARQTSPAQPVQR